MDRHLELPGREVLLECLTDKMGGFGRALLCINWPSLVTSFFHILSATSLLLLTFLILRLGHNPAVFPFPATLALIQTTSIAIMLGFWTIFGLFKPRHIPLRRTLILGFPDAVNVFISLLVIQNTSLSVYQASRLATPPVQFIFERAMRKMSSRLSGSSRNMNPPLNIHQSALILDNIRMAYFVAGTLLISATVVIYESAIPVTASKALLLVFSVIFAAGSRVAQLPLLRDTNVTELQLQLYTKTGALPFLVLIIAFTEMLQPSSPKSIYNYPFPEQHTMLVFFTSMLSFLSFVSMRASSSRSTEQYFVLQSIAISLCVFTMDWRLITSTGADESTPSTLWFTSSAAAACASGVFGSIRDAQLDAAFQQSGCGIAGGARTLEVMESAETRVRMHREELRRQLIAQQQEEVQSPAERREPREQSASPRRRLPQVVRAEITDLTV